MKPNGSLSTGLHAVAVVARVVCFVPYVGSLILKSFVVESHLQTQRAAVKMLHDRIVILVHYVTEALAGRVTLVGAFSY